MAENNQTRVNTSTQIRNMYSEGISYLNIKFFNTNLSFQFSRFLSKDATGRSTYDQQNALMTTVNWDGAFSLYKMAHEIINGKEAANGTLLNISCAGGASLILDRKMGQNGQMETLFIISKNNASIPFKFATQQVQVKENGQMVTKIIESGLGTFLKTLDGYLTGINAERHLNKMTEDFAKSQQGQQGQTGNNPFQTGSGYQNKGGNNNYKKPWNNNKKPYNNNNNYGNQGNQQQASWENQQPQQQNMSDYNIRG